MFHEFLTVTNSSMKKRVPNHAIMISCALTSEHFQVLYTGLLCKLEGCWDPICGRIHLFYDELHHQIQPNRIDTQKESECSMRIKQQRPSTNKVFMLIVVL